MKHKVALAFLLIATSIFRVQSAYASSADVPDYDEMIDRTDFIVVGSVTRIHNDTYTYVTIAIEEYLTNPQNISQITITIGGELQHAGELSGDSFQVGERVFVFAEKIGPYYRVMSGETGKYTVLEEWPPYVNTYNEIINGWRTSPDLWPRSVVYTVFKSTGHGRVNLFPLMLVQILAAVLLIPALYLFLKRRIRHH